MIIELGNGCVSYLPFVLVYEMTVKTKEII
jgi:hypothetical protein